MLPQDAYFRFQGADELGFTPPRDRYSQVEKALNKKPKVNLRRGMRLVLLHAE